MHLRYFVLSAAIGASLAPPLHAQEIDIRLSIKYILSASNTRAPGFFATEQNIIDTIDETNQGLRRFGRGYRFVIVGNIDEVREDQTPLSNSSDFYDLDLADENLDLEDAAREDPIGYHWRNDAVNVYIVNCCGGGAAIPSNAHEAGYGVVYISAAVNFSAADPDSHSQKGTWLHELGHHFNLIHTWDADDGVSDTRVDSNPYQCWGTPPPGLSFGCNNGGVNECCCTTKIANLDAKATAENWTATEYQNIRYNVMSYQGAADCVALGEDIITFDNMILTSGQLDRFADGASFYHVDEVSGLSYFVDSANTTAPFTGYSTDPYQTVDDALQVAGPRDIVLIRAGTYPENIRIDTATTLRATRGVARIGQ